MNYLGGKQVIPDLNSLTTHQLVGPFRTVVFGFSRYAETVDALPLLERIKLVLVTDFITSSYNPGNLPIVGVRLVGHADTDPAREQREPGSVVRISKRRAEEIEKELKKSVANETWMYSGRTSGPSPYNIRWTVVGVGSTEPHEENVRQKRTHANITEEGRKLNRRVEIFLEPGTAPVPDPVDAYGRLIEAIKKWEREQRGKHAVPPPFKIPGPSPNKRNEYAEFKCAALEQLKNFDVDTALSTLKDMFLKDPSETSDWTNSARQLVDEIDKRRRESEKEWWRDEECPGQAPPAPSNKPRLTVAPRPVVLQRGGSTTLRVTIANRPYGGSIEIELRNLPAKVTAPRRAIPSYQNFTDIPIDAAPDAPTTIATAVFADAYYPKVVTLQSDIFSVTVR